MSAATAVAGAAALSTVAATVAVTTTMVATFTTATVTTFAARAMRRLLLHIALGLGEQGLAAELYLAVLLVEGDDLHLELVALLDEAFEGGGVNPLVLADVHQTLLARQVVCLRGMPAELDEATPLNKNNAVSNSMKDPNSTIKTALPLVTLLHLGKANKIARAQLPQLRRCTSRIYVRGSDNVPSRIKLDGSIPLYISFAIHTASLVSLLLRAICFYHERGAPPPPSSRSAAAPSVWR